MTSCGCKGILFSYNGRFARMVVACDKNGQAVTADDLVRLDERISVALSMAAFNETQFITSLYSFLGCHRGGYCIDEGYDKTKPNADFGGTR